ncbi:MAG TPA: hypothetical protein VK923_05585 [Euzebyales bacterium]|nr:hypothetical protein [Euzebyales bacterium]
MLVGVVTWLTSDLMLFGALFAAYFFLRSRTAVWPPNDVSSMSSNEPAARS